MTNTIIVQNYIRFQLSELRQKNEHHRFEDMCRTLARLTICERILPATGPVAGSGDQGRDFESFRSYLASSPLSTSSFLGRAAANDNRMLVFACTLQGTALSKKINTDIDTIMSGPVHPEAIYYYSEASIKVATRHSLQKGCLEKHSTHLEIFDGQALAELLCQPDHFWIATEFLSIPTELYPVADDENQAYLDIKNRWQDREYPPQSSADLSDLRYLVRESTHNTGAKAELPGWIEKLNEFKEHTQSEKLKRSAVYEVCVASLKGLNDLTRQLPHLTEYFDAIPDIDDPVELVDVSTLLHYCFGAHRQAHLDIEKEVIIQWSERLKSKLDGLIAITRSDAYLCSLLQSRGTQSLLQAESSGEFDEALEELFDFWGRLVITASNAPMFPLEAFSDLLNVFVQMIGSDTRFLELCEKVDELLCQRTSGNVAAEKCRDRAIEYINMEQYTLAIRQLHTTKVNWLNAETEYGAVIVLRELSECYKNIGMFQAAKYYAMAAYFVAFHSNCDRLKGKVPLMSFHLAEVCYASGEWASFMEAMKLALYSQNAYSPMPQEIQEHSEMQRALVHLYNLRTLTDKFNQTLCAEIDSVIGDLQLDSFNQDYLHELFNDSTIPMAKASQEDAWAQLQDEFVVRPFADLGEVRTIEWKTLGVTWVARTPNRYNLVCALETLVATAQIVIIDLAKVDLALLPTTVEIELSLDDLDELDVSDHDGNDAVRCSVLFPRKWVETGADPENFYMSCVGIVSSLLVKCSTIDPTEIVQKIKERFEQGLTHKISVVQPYPVLFNEHFPSSSYQQIDRISNHGLALERDFEISEHPDVGWIDTPGRLYTQALSHEHIRNRYIKSVVPIKYSLKKWVEDSKFQAMVNSLRNDGFQDWRILLIVVNIALGFRLNQSTTSLDDPNQIKSKMNDLMHTEERADDVLIPVSVFTDEAVEIHKSTTAMGNAKTWGLVINSQTPDMEAMRKFLDSRYGNDTDDVDHDDPFKSSS